MREKPLLMIALAAEIESKLGQTANHGKLMAANKAEREGVRNNNITASNDQQQQQRNHHHYWYGVMKRFPGH
jgi:hypothetical protein